MTTKMSELLLVWMPKIRGQYRFYIPLWRVKRERRLRLGFGILARWEYELLAPLRHTSSGLGTDRG